MLGHFSRIRPFPAFVGCYTPVQLADLDGMIGWSSRKSWNKEGHRLSVRVVYRLELVGGIHVNSSSWGMQTPTNLCSMSPYTQFNRRMPLSTTNCGGIPIISIMKRVHISTVRPPKHCITHRNLGSRTIRVFDKVHHHLPTMLKYHLSKPPTTDVLSCKSCWDV